MFARFDLSRSLQHVRFAFGVRRVVSFADHFPRIPDHEIAELSKEFDSNQVLERPLPELEVGTEVDIHDGPFRGFRAVVHYHMPASKRVKILIQLLCRSTVVELNIHDLEVRKPYPEELMAMQVTGRAFA